ncbi:ROK family transcriptional regulator [Aureimonas jatrophae]|uniref:Sugar kinase of the NBD/HSP70 family, may contain an N-terminal HTH domain n=1 Tax=Aureimonas jatrophae TaxID=1166073 RepID=A0A1H0IRB7_9HYPH|nr:putative NBD/HSP70 family sugar kinase [Aureimonas jatrophae]SDO33938.1 Sugar kinase of the NBD/HSP70 family, may contain an N-terminal HTH domain [Aureimonas jatrophae]
MAEASETLEIEPLRPLEGPDGTLRGSNQASLRAHNERAVLSLIRRHGALAKSEIARLSGLSPQTASVIMRQLERDGLVLSGEPRRGRVGQPSVPMRLDPDGAFSLGLKLGRRTSEMVLMDFVGQVRESRAILYRYPRRDDILRFVSEAAHDLRATLPPALRRRIAGLGVGLPFELWSWVEANGAPLEELDAWRDLDAAAEIAALTGESVFLANDVTAACGAEQAFGRQPSADYVYFFVGAFVGGGIVIDGSLVAGRLGNAGALGSMPVAGPKGQGRVQLIHAASIHVLERMVEDEGGEGVDLWRRDADWTGLGAALDRWIATAAQGLAEAITSATAVYDFEDAVIDGSFPAGVRSRLVAAVREALAGMERRGLSPVGVREGTIGRSAREVGSASLPFFAKFLLDHRVLLTERG